jgi:hypothetical protein
LEPITDLYEKAVVKMLYLLGQFYRIEITEAMTQVWTKTLKNLTPVQIEQGFEKYISGEECEFPPKPGQIIQASGWRWTPPASEEKHIMFHEDPKKCPRCKTLLEIGEQCLVLADGMHHPLCEWDKPIAKPIRRVW